MAAAARGHVLGIIFAAGALVVSALGGESGPSRVISVGGPVTEIIYELGAADSLVAVDSSSLHPEAATKLPQVGYQRALSAEGVLSLKPTLVICAGTAGPSEAIGQIRAAGVKVEVLGQDYTLEGIRERIARVGELLGVDASHALGKFDAEAGVALASARELGSKPRVAMIMSRTGSPQVAGRDTAADAMIRLAGGENVGADFEGYKPVSAEAFAAMAPDVIILTQTDASAADIPGGNLTPAGRTGRIVTMDGLYLLGFGPRTPSALQNLVNALQANGKGSMNAQR